MSSNFRYRVSCALNVVLGLTLVASVLHQWDRTPVVTSMEASRRGSADETKALPGQPQLAQLGARLSAAEQRRTLVDQLREKGVPNDVLARFVLSDIEESWAERFEACHGDPEKLAAAQLAHDMGLDAEMRAALGAEGFKQWDQKNMLREAMLGSKMPLTAGEADGIYDLKKKLQRRQWDLDQARLNGKMDDTQISAASQKAYDEFGLQMKALMGEQRYAAAMKGDDGSAALKQDLARVNAGDSQFQQLLRSQQQLAERRAALDKEFQADPSSALYAERIKTLNEEQTEEYRRVLGDSAFDTLQKERDGSYMKMKKYGEAWGLDESKIDSVYGAIKYYQKWIEDYQDQAHLVEAQGQHVDWDAVNKNLQEFTQQTRQMLQKDLTQERFDRMQQNGVFPFTPTSPPPHSPPIH